MKLLLEDLNKVDDVGLIHTIYHTDGRLPYKRRRSYETPRRAAQQYFEYCDIMSSIGYTIHSKLGQAWYYEIRHGARIVETVEVQWPVTDWQREIKTLGGTK